MPTIGRERETPVGKNERGDNANAAKRDRYDETVRNLKEAKKALFRKHDGSTKAGHNK